MIFNSFSFVVFFVVVLGLYQAFSGRWTLQKALLLVASYLFYGAWNPPLVLLLIFSTLVDWFAAQRMIAAVSKTGQRAALLLSLCSNLGLLVAFKYGSFLLDSFSGLLALGGGSFQPPEGWDLVLPVGISFYTFQTLSFSIDVFRGRLDPRTTTPLNFALFVSFFPQLVAGPIVRAVDFLPQLTDPRRATKSMFVWGAFLLALGVFEKSVLADTFLAPITDSVFTAAEISTVDSWVGIFAFSGQIFFDFAGYSTCAIGAALCFGFFLPDNFWFPYGASSFSEFWQRWHISLSSWLRDYLYISLGGNRGGNYKTLRNLMLTMLLGGLWHGASWSFVFWGFLHGAFLVAERLLTGTGRRSKSLSPKVLLGWFVTQLGVLVAWVPFREPAFDKSLQFFSSMAGLGQDVDSVTTMSNLALVGAVTAALYVGHFVLRQHRLETLGHRLGPVVLGGLTGLLWITTWLAQPTDRAFIYFQF